VSLDLFEEAQRYCGEIEAWATQQGYTTLIGCDEAGRGPLAGPVVAAAVCLPSGLCLEGLNDSKVLSARVRERLFDAIVSGARAYGIVAISAEEIDRTNILVASLRAMGLAWEKTCRRDPEVRDALVLVDGNHRATLPAMVSQRPIVKGDARSTHIAAASVLAKVTRDRMMSEAHVSWPHYGFDAHRGYPTRAHREALRLHGPCPIHRRSFRLLARSS
jgi:ribonuclease HII